ncbi:MAG: hypothetical protein H6718_03145 [Polyangiaceae bacterium]|nr:hypothetical protein [Polyangiaceae bacterium]
MNPISTILWHSRFRPRWLLGIWGLGALACAEPPPKAPEPVLIEVQGDDEPSEPLELRRTVEDVSDRIVFKATGNVAIRRFLKDLLGALLRSDLKHFLELCEPENLAGQRQMGIGDEQYISEALVPYWSRARIDGDLAEEDAPRFQASDLRRIQRFVIQSIRNVEGRPGRIQVKGLLELSESVSFEFELSLRRDGEHLWLDPPVG